MINFFSDFFDEFSDIFSDEWPLRIPFAWFVGWTIYMIVMVLTVYDGMFSLIVQPICGAIFATAATVAYLLLTPILWVRPIGRMWNSTWKYAAALLIVSALLLCVGADLGLGQAYIDPETGKNAAALHPAIAISCYFAMVFAVANWPKNASLRNRCPK